MLITTQGVVIKRRSIGESDVIITILSKELGVVEASVNGSIKSKSALMASCQLMSYCEFILYKGKSMYRVNSADLIESFYSIRLDVEKASLAGYFCELANFISPTSENCADLIRLILNCLHMISTDKYSDLQIKSIFELRALSICGFMPDLVCCRECKCFESDQMLLDLSNGNIICKECDTQNPSDSEKIAINQTILSALRHIIYSDFNKLFQFKINDDAIKYLSFVTENYVLTHTEKSFNSLNVYKSLQTIF